MINTNKEKSKNKEKEEEEEKREKRRNKLKKREEDERKKIYDQLYDIKTLEVYKDNFKITEKAISYPDFVKLASEK